MSSQESRTAYTIGYEGLGIEGFARLLVSRKVALLIDVRELPLSRKPGFSKTALAHALARHGIGYAHLRALGSPRSLRKAVREEHDYTAFFEGYRAHLATPQAQAALEQAMGLARERTCVLMCYEQDPRLCHRKVLFAEMERLGLRVEELREPPRSKEPGL